MLMVMFLKKALFFFSIHIRGLILLVCFSANHNFVDLAAKTKEFVRLTTDFGIETCVAVAIKGFQNRLEFRT
jgi:hypothetical protein